MIKGRLFYLCRINTNSDQVRFGNLLHIGPAYQKMMHIAQALISVNSEISLVTVPVCNEFGLKNSKLGTVKYNELGVDVVSLGSICNKYFSRLYAAIAFLGFVIVNVKKTDRVVIYNFFPEYILAAIYLWFFGNKAVIDIEDAPRADEIGLVGYLTRWSFRLLRIFCQKKYITVSSLVAASFRLDKHLLIYGASPEVKETNCNLRKLNCHLKNDVWIKVLYGGALLQETGISVFCSAIEKLAKQNIGCDFGIEIIVTGFGGEAELKKLSNIVFPSWLRLIIKTNISYIEYEKILKESHVGLCLKIPGTTMADTTFPSKVVEIIRSKLLLITTPTSDVPVLFSKNEAVHLNEPYDDSLVAALKSILESPQNYINVAEAGIARSNSIFSYQSVGNSISNWLFLNK